MKRCTFVCWKDTSRCKLEKLRLFASFTDAVIWLLKKTFNCVLVSTKVMPGVTEINA